jgi:pyroglutamyl-peptidase
VAKRILLVGFEPFGGDKVSPSELIARSLDGAQLAGRSIASQIVPVETRNLRERFEQYVTLDRPDVVILLSQSGGRTALSIERVAVNVLDFDYPDNVGVMRKNDVISRGGAEARISNLPLERIVDAWHGAGVPGYVSNAAGTFIGNQGLYEMLALTEHASPPALVGLVHLPFLPAQAVAAGSDSTPSMSFELMKKGIETMIEALVPWVEQRPADAAAPKPREAGGRPMWIPRGVKEVER